jgi:RNA methyltransferase, TrmH family
MKIESTKNSIFKELLSLTKSKGVRETNKCLVSGEKITQEISKLSKIKSFWIHTDNIDLPKGEWQKTITLSDELFKKIDVAGTKRPILCSEFKDFKDIKYLDNNLPTLYVALSDPTNLGALIRTCAAFEWLQIVLLKESAHPFLPKAIRAASGTSFTMNFFTGPSIDDLKDPDIFALDMNGKSIESLKIKKNLKLLVGEEGKGVPKDFPGTKIKITISNKVESLNATIATSLLIYEWSKI